MKKILAIILAAVLVLSFAACKKNDTNNDTTAGDAQTSGQAADVSASDDTASSEEASSEVETEVVTDKEGHTVIRYKEHDQGQHDSLQGSQHQRRSSLHQSLSGGGQRYKAVQERQTEHGSQGQHHC